MSIRMTLQDAARATAGDVVGEATTDFAGVSTDSRRIVGGALFVALTGERFDGHAFIAAVRDAGAAAAMIDRARLAELAGIGLPLIAVDNTRLALGKLAAAWRTRFALPVIGVTGSNGKTTTKEMIAAILRVDARLRGDDPDRVVLATRGNLNNDIGLPLTLFTLDVEVRSAVIEMGMNHPGEIAYLADIAQPSVAIVTNAQRAHLQGVGSLDAVAREKGSIFAHMASDGTAIINADDAYATSWRTMAGQRKVMTFALDRPADVHGTCTEMGFACRLAITTPAGHLDVELPAAGRHNARNALAATAATLAAGVSLAAIETGLAEFPGVTGRLQRRPCPGGALLIDDAYNANPDSVRAAIDVLAKMAGSRVLVLGDMGEIGTSLEAFHAEVGAHARAAGVNRLFALGQSVAHAVAAFGDGAQRFETPEALLAELRPLLAADLTVLVKGSRFMRMERITDALAAEASAQAHPGQVLPGQGDH